MNGYYDLAPFLCRKRGSFIAEQSSTILFPCTLEEGTWSRSNPQLPLCEGQAQEVRSTASQPPRVPGSALPAAALSCVIIKEIHP